MEIRKSSMENRALPGRARRHKLGSMTDTTTVMASGRRRRWLAAALTGRELRAADIRKRERAWPELAAATGEER